MDSRKRLFLLTAADVIKELRGEMSQFSLASEGDISTSIISTVERGLKDPQITTFFKICEALKVKPHKVLQMVEERLPNSFSFIDK